MEGINVTVPDYHVETRDWFYFSNSTQNQNSTLGVENDTSAPTDAPEEEEEYDFLRMYKILFTYVAPVFIVCGVVGNLLSFIVLQSRFYRRAPSSFIMSALSVVDSVVLLTGLLRHWVIALSGAEVDIREFTLGGCHVHMFLVYYLPQLSSWSLCLMTLERLASVIAPFKAKQIFSRTRMIYAWVATAVSLAAINAHSFKTTDLERTKTTDDKNITQVIHSCGRTDELEYFSTKVWPWIDMALITLVPVAIIFTSNIVIVTMVTRASRLRSEKMRVKADNESNSITAMLISISVVFLLTTTPVSIFFIGIAYFPQSTLKEIHDIYVAYAVCNLLYYLSNSTNFLLYCLAGSRFRRALLVVVFCQKEPKRDTTSETAMSTVNRATKAPVSTTQVVTTVT